MTLRFPKLFAPLALLAGCSAPVYLEFPPAAAPAAAPLGTVASHQHRARIEASEIVPHPAAGPPALATNSFWLVCDPNPQFDHVIAYAGTSSRSYTQTWTGDQTRARITLIGPRGTTWFLAMKGFDALGVDSPYSDEVNFPYSPQFVVLSGWEPEGVSLERAPAVGGPFIAFTNPAAPTLRLRIEGAQEFYRARSLTGTGRASLRIESL